MKLLTLITHSMPQSQLFQQANMSPAFILTLTSCSVSSPPPSHAELLLQHDPWQANPQKWTWANWSKQPRSVTYDCQVHFLRYVEIRIFVQLHSLASCPTESTPNFKEIAMSEHPSSMLWNLMRSNKVPPFCAAMGDVFLKKKLVTPIHPGT